jgi:hypothetical protein
MYGVYTDIPMAYLLIAPYCTYGTDGRRIWDVLNFDLDGEKMPTFYELKESILKINNELETTLGENVSAELQMQYKKMRLLNNIQICYTNLLSYLDTNVKDKFIKDGNICLFEHEENENGEFRPYTYLYTNSNCKLHNLTAQLHDAITKCNKDCKLSIPYLIPLTKRQQDIGDGNYILTVKKNSDGTIAEEWSSNDIKFNLNEYSSLKSRLSNLLKDTDTKLKFFVLNGNKMFNDVKKIQDEVNLEIEKLGGGLNEEIVKQVETLLKFKPTIKNIFKILMGHLQAFITLLTTCIKDINNDNNRTIKNKGLSLKNLPDIPLSRNINDHLPPFPAVKKEIDNTFCYPKEPIITGKMAETNLIDSLFIGCSKAIEKNNEIDSYERASESENYFIPTCITDFNTPLLNGYNFNPYQFTFNQENGDKLGWVMTFFGFRCIQKFIMEETFSEESGENLTPEEFGAYEAYNFWSANSNLSSDIVKTITDGSGKDGGNFIKFLKGDGVYGNEKPCYHTGVYYNSWVKEIGNELIVEEKSKEEYCMPACVGYGGDFSLFSTNIKENGYSFIKGVRRKEMKLPEIMYKTYAHLEYGTRPYRLMKEIPVNILKDWNDSIVNLTNVPNGLTKHINIINRYLDFGKNTNNELYYPHDSKINEMHYNPAWNVIYEKRRFGKFFQKMDNHITSFNSQENKLVTVNSLSNKEEMDSHYLHSIQTMSQEPIFLEITSNTFDDSGAGLFLSSIPHNIYRIAKELSRGKKIINIPYTTKLFLGYVMDSIINCNEKGDIDKFFNLLTSRVGSAKYSWHSDPDYIIDGEDDDTTGKYCLLIQTIMQYLFVNDNGWFLETPKWDNVDGLRRDINENSYDYGHISMLISFLKTNGDLKRDISGFIDEFKAWKNSYEKDFSFDGQNRGICGWQWLKRAMSLNEKRDSNGDLVLTIPTKILTNNNSDSTFTYIRPKGNTQVERLKSILKRDDVEKCMLDLNSISDDTTLCSKNVRNPLSYYYVHSVEDIYTDKKNLINNAFSDIYSAIYYNTDTDSVILKFNPNYIGVQELDKLLKNVSYFIAPYNMTSDIEKTRFYYERDRLNKKLLKSKTEYFKNAHKTFIETIKKLYSVNETQETTENNVDYSVSDDSKLSMYRTLKNLYDKHFTNIILEEKNYTITDEKNLNAEFNKFHFIDTYYQDISDTFLFNSATLVELLKVITDGYQSGNGEGLMSSEMSVYSFMTLLCQKHNLMMLALPIFNGIFTEDPGSDNFQKMFKPINFNESQKSGNTISGPSYVCFYTHQASQHLENPMSQYENDGFLITDDLNNTGTFEGPVSIKSLIEDGKYVIPSFAVEYGSQKQSIFKSIVVNMDNPQVTEVSVANQFALAKNNNTDVRRLGFEGQDLFKIYSNYSFTCEVEMMGCAQIQPLMYFQLNNIPLFRGAYQIIQVEHDITPGNMTTKFKGVRINKTNIPMVSKVMEINMEDFGKKVAIITDGPSGGSYPLKTLSMSETNIANMRNYSKSIIGYKDIVNDSTLKEYIKFSDGKMTGFNTLNPSMRQLIYCILKDLPKLSEKLGYKIGMWVTSINRVSKNSKSEHCYIDDNNLSNRPNPKIERTGVKGYQIDNNGNVIKENQTYDRMCCAIDFHGTKNGAVDRGDASIQLFNHIAQNYNKYIFQLIWEMKFNSALAVNNISNVIHLSSLGETSDKIKCHIFEAVHDGKKTPTLREKNKLSLAFKQICNETKKSDNKNIIYLSETS